MADIQIHDFVPTLGFERLDGQLVLLMPQAARAPRVA
jgi:hypothetical protein